MIARESSMHAGTITVLVAILAIPLAILALLTFNTAAAEHETCGQTFVAGVDDTLARVREQGGSGQTGRAAVEGDLTKIVSAAAEANGTTTIAVDAEPTDTGVSARFSTQNGAELSVEISVTDTADYAVAAWTTSTVRAAAPGDTLWTQGT